MMALGFILFFAQTDPEGLLRGLRSDDPEERDGAAWRLRRKGDGARPLLEAAVREGDPDLAARSLLLLDSLELRKAISPRLHERFPGMETLLAHGTSDELLALFRAACRDRSLWPSDLQPLASRLLKTADPDLRESVLRWIDQQDLRGLIPELVERMVAEDSPAVRWRLLAILEGFEATQAVPALLGFLRHPDPDVRSAGLDGVVSFGVKKAIPSVVGLLHHSDPRTRADAVRALTGLGAHPRLPDIAARLRDSEPAVRMAACQSVLSLGAREYRPEVGILLGDPEASVRLAAARCLIGLWAPDVPPGLLERLPGFQSQDQAVLVRDLRVWSIRGAVPVVLPLLRSDHATLVEAAQNFLSGWHGGPVALEILPGIKDPSCAEEAAAVLTRLADPRVARPLARLLDDDDGAVRERALRILMAQGAIEVFPEFLRSRSRFPIDLQVEALVELSPEESPDAVRILLDLWGTASGDTRVQIVEALQNFHRPQVLEALLQATRDPAATVRKAALMAIKAAGDEDLAGATAERLLKDPDEGVRRLAFFQATEPSHPWLASRLVGYLADPDSKIRSQAEELLPSLTPEEAVLLYPVLEDPNPTVRLAAIRVLLRDPPPGVWEVLEPLTGDGHPDVEAAAWCAGAQLGHPECLPALLDLLRGPREPYLEMALDGLAHLPAELSLPHLLPWAREGPLDTRTRVLWALAEQRFPAGLEELAQIARSPLDPARERALAALLSTGSAIGRSILRDLCRDDPLALPYFTGSFWRRPLDPETTSLLVRRMADPHANVRWAARRLLENRGAPAARVPAIAEFLEDASSDLRKAGVVALGLLGQKDQAPRIARALDDPDEGVRASAATALGRLHAPEGTGTLRRLLEDPYPQVRTQAARTLGERADRISIPRLTLLLGDGASDVRAAAATALGRLEAIDAIPRLTGCLRDSDEEVRAAAAEALGSLKARESLPDLRRALEEGGRDDTAICMALAKMGGDGVADDLARYVLLHRRSRDRAAEALCLLGDRRGASLVTSEGRVWTLNGLRTPEVMRNLGQLRLTEEVQAPLESVYAEMARRLGLSLASPGLREGEPVRFLPLPGKDSFLDLLLSLEDPPLSWIVENGTLRLLPEGQARREWTRWWKREEASRQAGEAPAVSLSAPRE
jgi:HEAT repeat protein